ncbi:MAG TPA: YraN family protein [Flavisolibacter sp.]|jgi:putative endonuclease|nr:YraN family protein [Flavisolibacter sp.]
MAVHLELGKKGEQLAVDYLCERGYSILFRNWKYSRFEIDIIALKDDMPHFVEVKMRSSNIHGDPEQNVTRKKIRCLLKAINGFLIQHPQYRDFQLDVLSITINTEGAVEYFMINDIYL